MKKANSLYIIVTVIIFLLPACNKEKTGSQKPDPVYPSPPLRLESAFGWANIPSQPSLGVTQYFVFKKQDSTFVLYEMKSRKNTKRDSGNFSVNIKELILRSKKYYYLDDKENWQSLTRDKQLYSNCTFNIKSDTLSLNYKLPETNKDTTISFKAYLPPG